MSEFKLAIINLLNDIDHTKITTSKAMAKYKISFGVMERISPIKYPEYFAKPPYAERITTPSAIPIEENTPIIVSDEEIFDSIMLEIPSENNTAKPKREIAILSTPSITPIAIPVNAQWPIASEKNDILLFTIIVPTSPNKGAIRIIAKKAFFIKVNSTQEKGNKVSSKLYIISI